MSEPITLLINRSDIVPYAQIAINAREEETLQPHILSAQNIDIRPILGDALWTDLITNSVDAKYQTLLNGGTYTNENGDVITFQGLKASISCYTYARYIMYKNAVDTPFGVVSKKTEFSEQADTKLIMSIASDKRNEGGLYLNNCILFLQANETDYPLFGTTARETTKKFIHKLTGASKI